MKSATASIEATPLYKIQAALVPLSMPTVTIDPTAEGLHTFLTRPIVNGPVTVRGFVGPLLAAIMLTRNVMNRNKSPEDVRRWAALLQRNRWRQTGHGIAFGETPLRPDGLPVVEDGLPVLYDGQHRLEAVVVSGVPIWMNITVGLKIDDRGAIDTGRKRTLQDELYHVRPLAKFEIMWSHTARILFHNQWPRRVQLDRDVHERYYAENQEAIEWGKQTLTRLRRPVGTAAVTGALVFAYALATTQVNALAHALHTKSELLPKSPELAAVNYLINGTHDPEIIVAQKILRCVRAMQLGEQIDKLLVSQEATRYFLDGYPSEAVLKGPEGAYHRARPVPPVNPLAPQMNIITDAAFGAKPTVGDVVQTLQCGVTTRFVVEILKRLGLRSGRMGRNNTGERRVLSHATAVRVARYAVEHPSPHMRAWRRKTEKPYYLLVLPDVDPTN